MGGVLCVFGPNAAVCVCVWGGLTVECVWQLPKCMDWLMCVWGEQLGVSDLWWLYVFAGI